jgi:hypothetical protein
MIKDRDITFKLLTVRLKCMHIGRHRASSPNGTRTPRARLIMRWVVELEMDEQRLLDALAA